MKTATLPPLRVEPELRRAAQDLLREGETLSAFVEGAVRESVERRRFQAEFIARGLASEAKAKASGRYLPAKTVLAKMEKILARARKQTDAGRRKP